MEFTKQEKNFSIVDLQSEDEATIRQVAALLVEGFAVNWPETWPDVESATEEHSYPRVIEPEGETTNALDE